MNDVFHKIYLINDDGICTFLNRNLHRYHAVDANLFLSLQENYLWFSNPLDFNDPFDCNIDFDFDNTPGELESFFRELNELPENAYRKLTEEQLKVELEKCINDPNLLSERSKRQSLDAIENIGICCFSESDDNLLMWSHYGDKHMGVCLTFDVIEDKNLFLLPYAVEYIGKYPKLNWIRDRRTFKSRRLEYATKSIEWSYEKEVRVIKNESNVFYRGEVEFNKRALKAIKLGYKTKRVDYLVLKQKLEDIGGYEHVRFFKAKLKKFEYGIEYEELFG
jgi:hypothetical protein